MPTRTYIFPLLCLAASCKATSPSGDTQLPPVGIDCATAPSPTDGTTGCLKVDGGTTVRADWRIVEPATDRARIEGTVELVSEAGSWRKPLRIEGPEVAAALAGAESTQLDAHVSSQGLVRIGILARHGEDSFFERELVELFAQKDGRTLWSGVGTETEVELDACTRTREARFTLLPNGSGVSRTVEARAEFRTQPLDPELLDRVRRDCVVASAP